MPDSPCFLTLWLSSLSADFSFNQVKCSKGMKTFWVLKLMCLAVMVYTVQFYHRVYGKAPSALGELPARLNELGFLEFLSRHGSECLFTDTNRNGADCTDRAESRAWGQPGMPSCPGSHQVIPSLVDVLRLMPVNSSTLYSSRCSSKPCAHDASALRQPFTAHITSFSRKAR